jgi:uncharacterized protein involved in outer membrane biogenesis
MPGGQAGGHCLLMRRLFRWAFRLLLGLIIVAVVGVAAGILLLDTIARELLVKRLHSATGMEVKINAVHVGLLSPTVSIEGLKLYNSADFGGAPCLDMPELHIEYDPSALRARQLHLTLLRLDLADLSVVVDKKGRKNFDPVRKKNKESAGRKTPSGHWQFIGIDVVNATLGKFQVSNMASGRGEEIDFSVKNQIVRNVKTWSDLAPLGVTTLSRGKAASSGDANMDLSQLMESLLKGP